MAERDPQRKLSLNPKSEELLVRVAKRLGTSEEEAITRGLHELEAELDRTAPRVARARDPRPLRERMIEFWKRHPLPEKLGPVPDKAFYDDLSGDL